MTELQPYFKKALKASREQQLREHSFGKFRTRFRAHGLTAREQEVALLILSGLAYKAIAQKLELSIHTVNTHVKNIFIKLNIKRKSDLFNLKGLPGPVPRSK